MLSNLFAKRGEKMANNINNNLIVFESDPDFSDNSRGLWEYITNNTNYETFWVIRNLQTLNLLQMQGIPCGMINSEISNKMIENAKYLVSSSFEFAYNKRPEQIHISAWHGFPLKLIGFFDSAAAASDENAYNNLKIITTQSDIITATSRFNQLILSGLLAVDPRKVKDTGFPRNDLMFKYDGKTLLKKLVNINLENSNLILYLPTMRKGLKNEGDQFNNNIFNYPDYDPEKIDDFLEKNNAYIIAKLHFADNTYYTKENFKLPKRLIFLDTDLLNNQLLTIYHIMNAFDVLITDYSSVYVDFLLLDKPIIFSCPDLSKYNKDRGFIVDNPKDLMPGSIIMNQNELFTTLDDIFNGVDNYSKIREEKFNLFHSHNDANSSKRLFDEMIKFNNTTSNDASKSIANSFLPNMSPLYQYTLNGKAEFYFDMGNGFNEIDKSIINYQINKMDNYISFELEIPADTKNIRFDPDIIGRWILQDFVVTIDKIEVQYDVLNGNKIGNKIYLAENDPQILIPIKNVNCKELKIGYYCLDSLNSTNELVSLETKLQNMYNEVTLLNKQLTNANNTILSMENSKSWKITKPLRSISKIFKK